MTAIPSHHPKYRSKLCRNFANGNCPFGQKCSFLHPQPGADPLSSSLAQYLVNWNMLLPHLLSSSNQQGILKNVPWGSPPRSQVPQLIDEDPSPPTSLLLSTSDCTSSEHVSQTKRFNRRKRTPCRHFVRTGGWCPAGAKCRFFHDVTALPSADGQTAECEPQFETDEHRDSERTISGGVLMGVHLPSPPPICQEQPEPPRYTEAELGQPYQPMYWPGYTWHPYQPYYAATVPATAPVPVRTSMAPSSAIQHDTYQLQPQTSAQSEPPSTGTQTHLPLGAYQVNGTTYFPTQMPSVPAPAPVPVYPASFSHTVPPPYPYYAPPPLGASCYDIPNQTLNSHSRTSFNPFSSDPMMPSELPVIPRPEDYQISPIQQDGFPPTLSSTLVPAQSVEPMDPTNRSKVQDQEFPYQPRKNQQVGHTRRISINVKKHDRTNSG